MSRLIRSAAIYTRAATAEMTILPGATSRRIRAVLATDTKQRDGLALDMGGVNLTRYRNNPVLLVGHETHKLPIGKVDPVVVERHRLVGDLQFGRSDLAQSAKQDVLDGIVNHVSIGFDPDRNYLDRRSGRCSRWSLTEVSLVGVPMDEEARIFERAARAMEEAEVDQYELLVAMQQVCDERGIDLSMLLRGELPSLDRAYDAGYDHQRTAVPTHDTPVTDGTWDGPAAVAAAPNDEAVLRHMHAWMDSGGDPNAKSTWKFPHHGPTADSPANLAGVRNALARLPQADIPEADRAGVERHLRNHLDAAHRGDFADHTRAHDSETPVVPAPTDAPAQVDLRAAQDLLAAFPQLKGAS